MVLVTILTILFTLVAASLVLIILVQRPQGGGLSGAFGGAGGGADTVFGGRTGDALTLATVVAFVLFLGLSIGLNLIEVKPDNATTPADETAPAETTDQFGGTAPAGATQPIPMSPGAQTPGTPGQPTVRELDPSQLPPEVLERARQQGGVVPLQPPAQEPPAEEPGGTEPDPDGIQPE